jgi:hypothetical protein
LIGSFLVLSAATSGSIEEEASVVKIVSANLARTNERLTLGETQRLFAGLESFANLEDSFEAFCEFARQWPDFCPISLKKPSGEPLPLVPHEQCHALVIRFRDFLRLVWRRDPVALQEQLLKILLGLTYEPVGHEPQPNEEDEELLEWVPLDTSSPEALAESQRIRGRVRERAWHEGERKQSEEALKDYDPRIRSAVWALMHDRKIGTCRPWRPLLVIDWEHSTWNYEPMNNFQRAAYALFRNSWRARNCRECARFFIASKQPQTFCGVQCYIIARRRRDLELWKTRGSSLRQKRRQKARGRKVKSRGRKGNS